MLLYPGKLKAFCLKEDSVTAAFWDMWVADTGHVLPLLLCSYLFSAFWTGATWTHLYFFTKRLSLEARVYLSLCFAIVVPVITFRK